MDIIPHGPLNRKEHTFFQFVMADGSSGWGYDIEYYKGDYKK